ncbi:MAG: hypothetical protein J6D26_06975 [Clostridia bacterium]|nr:hypothetical protein [Clostridia bacterium]
MKFKLPALVILILCLLTVGAYAMDISTDSDLGTVSVSGDFGNLRSEQVSVAVFEAEGGIIPLYANQTVTHKGKYSHEFPLLAPAGTYKLVVSAQGSTQSGEFRFEPLQGVVQYSENFENTLDLWSTTGDVHIENGALAVNYGPGFKRAWIDINPEYLWDNLSVSFSFTKGETFGDDNWIGVDLNRQADGSRNLIYWRSDKLLLTRLDGTSTVMGYYNFNENESYDIKITAQQSNIRVYVKTSAESDYTLAGTATALLPKGTVGLSAWNTHTSFDNLKVANLNSDILVQQKPMLINTLKTSKINLVSDSSASYALDNTSVASVLGSGYIWAVGEGTANITVTSGDITEVIPIKVVPGLTDFALSEESLDLYIGEAIGVETALTPNSLTDVRLIWTSSDDGVVSVFGSADTAKTLVAEGVGTAVITVSTPDGSITKTCTVTVTKKSLQSARSSLFEADTEGKSIPSTIFGMHYPLAGYVNIYKDFYYPKDAQLFKSMGIGLLRGPEGGPANNYRWRTGDLSTRPLANGYPGFFIEDAYKIPEEIDVPYSFAVNVYEQTVEDIIDQVNEIKNHTTQPIYLEMGNEVYDTFGNGVFPEIGDYVAKCRDIYKAVKALDPDIKIGIVITVDWLADRLYSVPYIADWNDVIAANPDCYDAVIPHYYASMDDMSGFTEEEFSRALTAYNAELYKEMQNHAEMFPGKEIWATEYGMLYSDFHSQTRVSEMNRLQLYKTPATATYNAELLLNMVKSGNVTLSAFHTVIGDGGLSAVQRSDDGHNYLPNYYTLTKVGELINDYGYYYHIDALQVDTETVSAEHICPGTTQNIEYGGAWGFGDAEGVRKAVVFNRSAEPMRVMISGYELSREWSYGGKNHFGNYLKSTEYCNAFPEVELPWTGSEDYALCVTLEPYTMAVFDLRKAEDKSRVYVMNACYTMGNDNKIITALQPGTVKSEYTVSNTGSTAKTADVICAVYKLQDGVLSLYKASCSNAEFKANTLTPVKIDFEIPASGDYIVKTMFLETIESLKPCCKAQIIE